MQAFALRLLRAGRMSRAELSAAAACAFVYTLWNASARGVCTLETPLFFALWSLACVLAGRLIATVVGPDADRDAPTVLLFGFLALNTALFVLAWVSPLPIVVNAAILLAAVVLLQTVRPDPAPGPDVAGEACGEATGRLTLMLSLIAATFWCVDSITPQIVLRPAVVFRPWTDCFGHSCEIRMFRDGRGFATLEDVRMPGHPPRIYHYASYLVPALVSAATPTSAYLACGSFLVPVGVLLSGLAAHALVRSLWGGEAGVAATVAVLLLPDASSHGLRNPVLSFHWLEQITPMGPYGVALVASAWLFMFAGCRSGRLALVGLSFLTASLAVHFKSHLFVAAALLLWLYPGLFVRGVSWRRKAAWLVFALVCFFSAIRLAQRVEAVPTLRLDFSALKHYMNRVVSWLYYASSRDYFARFTPGSPLTHDLYWGSILLSYATVGLFGVVNLLLAFVVLACRVSGRRLPVTAKHAMFPVVILANYLVMSLGLAYDPKNPGHPEELLHRPLVWAYFVAAAWAGGMSCRLLLPAGVLRSTRGRAVLAALALALLVVPYRFGPNVQVGPHWGTTLTNQSIPRGLFECARYIEENADAGDVVQESSFDPKRLFSALCEHPAYAIAYFDGKPNRALSARIRELEAFHEFDDLEAIRRFAARRRIRWYVLRPEDRVSWPDSLVNRPDFSWGQFRVYSFPPEVPEPGDPMQTARSDPAGTGTDAEKTPARKTRHLMLD